MAALVRVVILERRHISMCGIAFSLPCFPGADRTPVRELTAD
jgi:hypothetical protein